MMITNYNELEQANISHYQIILIRIPQKTKYHVEE